MPRLLAALSAAAVSAALLAGAGGASAAPSAGPSAKDRARVVVGSDGYLFIAQDWTVPCQDAGAAARRGARAGARLDQLGDALVAGGREAVVTIAPDKSTVRSGNVRRPPQAACAKAQKDALWAAATRSDRFLDLRRPLASAGARWQTYWRKDTHWTPTGAGVYAAALAERLDPLLPLRLTLTDRTWSRTGDLATVLRRPARETVTGQQLGNRQVSVREAAPRRVGLANPVRTTRATPGLGGAVLPGRTVLVGDSMHDAAIGSLAPLFEEAVFVWVLEGDPLAPVLAELRTADRVVLESVERFAARSRMTRDDALAGVRALPRRTPGVLG